MRRLLLPFFLLLLPSLAFAVVPEIPADGLDNGASSGTKGACPTGYMDAAWGDGCDLMLPATFRDGTTNYDRDGDGWGSGGSGYLGEGDCDDEDPLVYEGVFDESGCSAGQYRTCTSSTWSACASLATYCDYTIDAGAGSDANDGSYATPFASIGMISGGGTSPPSGAVTLAAGDVVCLKGSTNFTTTYNDGTRDLFAELTVDGTSANPITFVRLPSSTAIISSSGTAGFFSQDPTCVQHYKFVNIKMTTGSSTAGNGGTAGTAVKPFQFTGGGGRECGNIELERVHVFDSAGNGNDNFGAFFCDECNETNVHHSFFDSIKTAVGNDDNTAAVLNMDDGGTAGGENHYHHHNTMAYDSLVAANGACIRQKHSYAASEGGANGYRVEFNRCINAENFIHFNASKLRAKYNLLVCDSSTPCGAAYMSKDTADMQDNFFSFNTFINADFLWRVDGYSSGSKLEWYDSVLVDSRSSYAGDTGTVMMDVYADSTDKTNADTNNVLDADRNTYYNASATLKYFLFDSTSITFATWQGDSTYSTSALDANSHNEDPSHNAYFEPTATNSLNRGWLGDTSALSPGAAAASAAMMRGQALAIKGRRQMR